MGEEHVSLFERSGADFSVCGRYRYRLFRHWADHLMPLVFVMLNPSIATAEKDDPTVARCATRAHRLGFGGLVVVNIFAWVSTDPTALLDVADPVGPENDAAIIRAVHDSTSVVLAWGKHGGLKNRQADVLRLLERRGAALSEMRSERADLLCLGVNDDGSPQHPLYIGYDVPLRPYVST